MKKIANLKKVLRHEVQKSLTSVAFLIAALTATVPVGAQACSAKSVITGFTSVKGEVASRAYFYQPDFKTRRKAYLVEGNFVQVASEKDGFACAVFRNYDGSNERITSGWLELKDLHPIRRNLTRADMPGSWTQIDCKGGDSCLIEISENAQGLLHFDILSHIHQHPGAALDVQGVTEESRRFALKTRNETTGDLQTSYIIFQAADLEPGTLKLQGDPFFQGLYRKQ